MSTTVFFGDFFVEAVHARDLSGLMVASEEVDMLRVHKLHAKK